MYNFVHRFSEMTINWGPTIPEKCSTSCVVSLRTYFIDSRNNNNHYALRNWMRRSRFRFHNGQIRITFRAKWKNWSMTANLRQKLSYILWIKFITICKYEEVLHKCFRSFKNKVIMTMLRSSGPEYKWPQRPIEIHLVGFPMHAWCSDV